MTKEELMKYGRIELEVKQIKERIEKQIREMRHAASESII